jgi:carbon storage regulator
MLVLSRKPSQQIMIGPDIQITIVKIDRNQVRIGIQAPPGVPILRSELADVPRAANPPSTPTRPSTGPVPIRNRRISTLDDD